MARVTVEDCIDKVDNRFDLVLLAAHRAKQISKGAGITISREGDKNTVLALREIAHSSISTADLKEEFIHSLQHQVEADDWQKDTSDEQYLIESQLAPIDDIPYSKFNDNSKFEDLSEDQILSDMEKLAVPENSDNY